MRKLAAAGSPAFYGSAQHLLFDEGRTQAPGASARAAGAAVVLAACAIPFSAIVWLPGAPAFLHDWGVIPAVRGDYDAWLLDAFSPVRQYGAARAAAGAPNYFMIVPMAAALGIFGQRGACVMLALLCAGVLGCGVWSLARAFRWTPLQAAVFAICYAGSPALLNQIFAGHTSLIMVYAAAPLLLGNLRLFCERRASWAALGTSAVLMAAQVQGLIVLAIVAAAFFASRARSERLWPAFAVMTVSIVACEAAQYQTVVTAAYRSVFEGERATIPWEMAQSAAPPDALASLGYIGGYDALVTARVPFLQPSLEFAAALAVIIVLLRRRYLPAMLALAGMTLVSGLSGPLRPILVRLFTAFDWATTLREFYSFSSLTALGVALAVAATLEGGLERRAQTLCASCALAIAAVFAAFAVAGAGASMQTLPRYAVEPEMARALATVASDDRAGRVLFLPFATPVGPAGTPGGNDPYYLGTRSHPSVNGLFPPYPDATVAFGLDQLWEGDARAAAALQSLGVRYVVVRKRWQSTFERGAPWLESRSGFARATGADWEARVRALRGATRTFASPSVDVFELPAGGAPAWIALPASLGTSSVVPASDQPIDYRCDRPSCGLVTSAFRYFESSQLVAFGAYPAVTTKPCVDVAPGAYELLARGAWRKFDGGRVCGPAGHLRAVLRVERRSGAFVAPKPLVDAWLAPSTARWNAFGTEATIAPAPASASRENAALLLPYHCSSRWSAADAGGELAAIDTSFGCLWKPHGRGASAIAIRYSGWQLDLLATLLGMACFAVLLLVAVQRALLRPRVIAR